MFDKQQLNRLYRYCLALAGETELAFDLVQTATENALRASGGETKPLTYAFRIARNAYIDIYRKSKRRPLVSISDEEEESGAVVLTSGFASLESVLIDRQQLEQLLAHLESQERELLYLWAVEGYSVGEIAEMWQCPRGTLLSRIHRLRQRIQANIAEARGSSAKEAVSQ